MNKQGSLKASRSTVWVVLALAWTALIVFIVYKTEIAHRAMVVKLAEVDVQSTFEQDTNFRKWAAGHGGLYVPVTEKTQPNPGLAHIADRDILTPSGKMLTLINPAYMSRQVYAGVNADSSGWQRITSLNPVHPANAPDAWEKQMMQAVESGVTPGFQQASIDDVEYLRMIFPYFVEEPCLKCHAAQGYKIGALRGALSIATPLSIYDDALDPSFHRIQAMIGAVWFVGLVVIAYAYRIVRKQLYVVEGALDETRMLETKYRTLFDQAAGGICVVDLESGEVVDCNQGMVDLIETSRAEMIGRPQADLFPEDDDDGSYGCFVKRIWRQVGDDKGEILEKQIVTKDGKLKDVQIKAAPLVIGGRKLLQGFFYDITVQKKIQTEAIRTSQLASIGELSAGVAHEINNPIGGVINYAQILLNKKSCGDYENEVLQRIVNEGLRISQIVKRLLSFSRKGTEDQYVVNLGKIVEAPLALVNAHLIRDGIKVNIQISDGLPPVKCNLQQLEQLVLNLVNNSRYALNEKYPEADERKKINISAETTIFKDKKYILFVFCDYGIGISADYIRKVKEPFCTSKPVGEGTGLGLSICEEIVTNHQGLLIIDSVHGEFTRVKLYLPVDDAMESRAAIADVV